MPDQPSASPPPKGRLVSVTLDEASIGRGSPDQEHERAIAIYDILETNSFRVPGQEVEAYALDLSLVENKLCFHIRAAGRTRLSPSSAGRRSA